MIDKRVFFDTNILVYANDTSFPDKRMKARALIRETLIAGYGILSTQVLAEFWVTVTRKLRIPLDSTLAREQIALFSSFTIVPVDQETFLLALTVQERYGLSFWDSQLIASASLSGIELMFSEDMQSDAIYEGVRVNNPFLD